MSYQQHQRESQTIGGRCAVITLSDTRSKETDKSGQRIGELLSEAGHQIVDYQLIPDDPAQLNALLGDWLAREDIDAVFSSGGTGVSRRDNTIAVVERRLTLVLPGFGELFRMLSWQEIGSGAMLSRATGGVADDKLLFALPGSTGAVELALTRLIVPELRHLLHELRK